MIQEKLDKVIRTIPNFPKEGISFKDITPLLLDASLEGELDLVKRTAKQVPDPSAANDEGITALHNAICAGHLVSRFRSWYCCWYFLIQVKYTKTMKLILLNKMLNLSR